MEKPVYDFFSVVDRRGTDCIKWDRGPLRFGEPDILPLWIADTDFACPPAVEEALIKRISHPVLG